MKSSVKILALTSTIAITSCGAFSTKEEGRKAEEITAEIAGKWRSSCAKLDWFNFSQSSEEFAFSAFGDFDKTTSFYSDECKTTQVVVETEGTTSVLGDAKDGAKNINFTVTAAKLTPKTDEAVKALNLKSYCGVKDWAVGKGVNITDLDCEGKSYKKGTVVFDIYRKDDDVLYFGKSGLIWNRGTKADNRPEEVDQSQSFQKRD